MRTPEEIVSARARCKKYYYAHLEEQRARNRKISKIRGTERRNQWLHWLNEQGYTTCSKCGYDKCQAAIDYHHINSGDKKENIGTLLLCSFIPKNITKIKSELDKCIPLCVRCHRELHDEEVHGANRNNLSYGG